MKKWIQLLFVISLTVVFSAEVFSGYYNWLINSKSYKKSDSNQLGFFDDSNKIIQDIKQNDNKFYRIAKDFNSVNTDTLPSNNDSQIQGYFGLEGYNSGHAVSYLDFLQDLDIWTMYTNVQKPEGSSDDNIKNLSGPILNYVNGVGDRYRIASYLGTKYYISNNDQAVFPDSFEKVKSYKGFTVYENKDVYPLVFSNHSFADYNEFVDLDINDKDIVLMNSVIVTKELQDQLKIKVTPVKEIIERYSEKSVSVLAKQYQKNMRLLKFREDNIILDLSVQSKSEIATFSIPYDTSWVAYIDGKAVETYSVNLGLLGISVPKGTHTVQLRYVPKGLVAGVVLSTLLFLVIILLYFYNKNIASLKKLEKSSLEDDHQSEEYLKLD